MKKVIFFAALLFIIFSSAVLAEPPTTEAPATLTAIASPAASSVATVSAAPTAAATAAAVAAGWPVVIDGGIAKGSFAEKSIIETKNMWTTADAEDLVTWIKITPGSDWENGAPRFYYKTEYITPDGSIKMLLGSFGFDAEGFAKDFRGISFFNNCSTADIPKPKVTGIWKINYYLFDSRTNESRLVKEMSFTLESSLASILASPEATASGSEEIKSEADRANEEEIKKLKAELAEMKKLFEDKNTKKAKAKPVKKKAPKKT